MKKCKFLYIGSITALFFLLLVSCTPPTPEQIQEQGEPPATAIPTVIPTETPFPTPTASDKATYALTFNATWSATTHPAAYDSSAHFSPFIAYTTNGSTEGKIFLPGEFATEGMEEMAETGITTLLEGEVGQVISIGAADTFIKGQRIDSPGIDTGTLTLTQGYNHLVFVSMIAPSPDWFVSAEVVLFKNGQWIEELEIQLISYDSGTDSGITLTAVDSNTNPPETISILGDELQNMGSLTFIRIN